MTDPHSQLFGPATDSDKVRTAVAQFGQEVMPRMHGDGRMEDRIREPVYNMLRTLAATYGRDITVHDEVTLPDGSARPDFAVDARSGRIGFIELKSEKKGIPNNWNHPTKHDRDQWKVLRGLPNIIYTDGKKWALYQKGDQWGETGLFEGDLYTSGSRLKPAGGSFEALIRKFLVWKPEPPTTLRGVVLDVAPVCRLLRYQVAEQMSYERTSPKRRIFTKLADEWRGTLFPNLDDDLFADAYAQTVTFSLLLARINGVVFDNRSLGDIADQLSKQHSLMGEALSILTKARWVKFLSVVDLLRQIIGNISLDKVGVSEPRDYAVLYETFLSEYDPQLRRKSGTYYTPDSVARAMVRLSDQILKQRFGKIRGFAAKDVHVIDPAMGTGTFLVEIINSVVSTLRQESGSEKISGSHISELFADRLIGFENQAAPFAVAEMRLHHTLKNEYDVELPRKEVRFLSNALDNPDTPPLPYGQLYDVLKDNYDQANMIKRFQDVTVVIGNPPWRQHATGDAPWIEAPRDSLTEVPEFPASPSLDDFRLNSQDRRAFNLSNMWTFFWRWASWKVFEANPNHPAGIVALISPQAYMTSDAYSGMRKYLRDKCDEGWIIDLSPEGFQPPTATRIFPTVQQPICVGIFARYGIPNRKVPAKIHYVALEGTRAEKFFKLSLLQVDGNEWTDNPVKEQADSPRKREAPLLPIDPVWLEYPRLQDLLPWQQPGITPNRNWVYAPDRESLHRRWLKLLYVDDDAKRQFFKETDDRKIGRKYPPLAGIPSASYPLAEERKSPRIAAAGFRSFDRQYLIYDRRVIDRPRRELWFTSSSRQIYVCEPPAYRFSSGPALTFSDAVPNVDYFMGHSGGQIHPLFRDAAGCEPNVTPRLLSAISAILQTDVTEMDLIAYLAAIASNSHFTKRFTEELRAPGVRIPVTRQHDLWMEAVKIGEEVVWIHTYGQRFADPGDGRPLSPPRLSSERRPRPSPPIPATESPARDILIFDSPTESLLIGDDTISGGPSRITCVTPAMWDYKVGDMHVISSWFDYRRQKPQYKKRTSGLDDINESRWSSEFDDGLFDLLNVVGRCIELEGRQAILLDRICEGPLISATELTGAGVLPPTNSSTEPPRSKVQESLDDV